MPRRPTRHRRSLNPQPLTFSSFSRSVAQVASSFKAKHRMQHSKQHRESAPKSAVNGFSNNTLEAKGEQSVSSDEEEFEGVVQADFAFFDPKANDFHGVKTLLQTYLDDKQWDLSGFVDLVLGQTTVGTVVKIEDDEDEGVFSLVTALNMQRYKDHKCILELKEFLLKACQEKDVQDNLISLLGEQAQYVGLLVSQRVVNLPPQLLPPLYDALFDEVSWATEDEPTEELKNSFRFKFYILVSKIYKVHCQSIFSCLFGLQLTFSCGTFGSCNFLSASLLFLYLFVFGCKQQNKNANKKKKLSSDSDEAIIYTKPEDEIFHRTQQPATLELRNYRFMGLVMAIEADKISTFRQELKSLINES
ncbi:hypothetical protein I3843_05G172700 [Carya illinoinensis]|uniref:Protein BCCIP homolog n=1 Tax=Carya illinoinensis TaxID=32201 RepID=A0A922F137_CARIL|nr:hypothetical protein I3760_05G190700 [Carya illinoinensis]KAG6714151.1 hypothetical protein I3842_05G189100 [Carya illinoinensis]KAG7980253.1 hypothetical protein I3843_05G172700 [Carya illinoinensis]